MIKFITWQWNKRIFLSKFFSSDTSCLVSKAMSSYRVKSLGIAEIHSCGFPAETAGSSKMWKNPQCFTENYTTVFGKLNYDIFFKAVLIKSTAIV